MSHGYTMLGSFVFAATQKEKCRSQIIACLSQIFFPKLLFHFKLFIGFVVYSVHCFVAYYTVILKIKTTQYILVPRGSVVDLIPSSMLESRANSFISEQSINL